MGHETVLFKSEEKKTLGEAAEMLLAIAAKLESGSITLSAGEKEVTLQLPAEVELEIKAEEEEGKKGSKRSLEIELEWVVGDPEAGSSGVSVS